MISWLLFGLASLCLIMIPFAPALLRLRIRFLRWLHWDWAVNLLESHFEGWVMFLRIALFVVAAIVFYFGWLQ